MEKDSHGILLAILYSLGTVAVAVLGGVTKLYQDFPDATLPISRRDWLRYLTSSLLAGIVLSIAVYHQHGPSPLLFAVAGVAGFGSIQLLGFCVVLLKGILKRLFGSSYE